MAPYVQAGGTSPTWAPCARTVRQCPDKARAARFRPALPHHTVLQLLAARVAIEDACEHDMFVQIRWRGRKMAVPFSQLEAIGADESNQEAIGDWHYWVAQGCIL